MSENKIFKGKSILFGSPVFFGYEAAIKNKLIELGADVNKLTKKNGNPSIALVARFSTRRFCKGRGFANANAFEEISFTKRSAAEIVDVVRSSRAVLDIQHFKQTGLTMRTLETFGAGKKLITTNHEVKKYDFYDESRVKRWSCFLRALLVRVNLALSFVDLRS